jgi:hypothetical protein
VGGLPPGTFWAKVFKRYGLVMDLWKYDLKMGHF